MMRGTFNIFICIVLLGLPFVSGIHPYNKDQYAVDMRAYDDMFDNGETIDYPLYKVPFINRADNKWYSGIYQPYSSSTTASASWYTDTPYISSLAEHWFGSKNINDKDDNVITINTNVEMYAPGKCNFVYCGDETHSSTLVSNSDGRTCSTSAGTIPTPTGFYSEPIYHQFVNDPLKWSCKACPGGKFRDNHYSTPGAHKDTYDGEFKRITTPNTLCSSLGHYVPINNPSLCEYATHQLHSQGNTYAESFKIESSNLDDSASVTIIQPLGPKNFSGCVIHSTPDETTGQPVSHRQGIGYTYPLNTPEDLLNSACSPHFACICAPGTKIYNFNDNDCTDCPNGKFSHGPGSTKCFDHCLPNTIKNTASRSCERCGPGQIPNAVWGATACVNCPAGQINPHEGGTCKSCPVGLAAIDGIRCGPCQPGTFKDFSGPVCSNCPVAKYTVQEDQPMCKNCPEGHYFTTDMLDGTNMPCQICDIDGHGVFGHGGTDDGYGATGCDECPAGRYVKTTNGINNCEACDAGQYQDAKGADDCKLCDAGRYQNAAAAPSCKACSTGQYQWASGKLSCDECPEGWAQSQTGQTNCVECQQGQYQDAKGEPSCKVCEKGKYVDIRGEMACFNCIKGKYNDETGSKWASSCKDCPTGRYNTYEAMQSCQNCVAGTYNAGTGSDAFGDCKQCPVGFSSTLGSDTCALCTYGRYADVKGLGVCKQCPSGYINPNTGSVSDSDCTECLEGTYNNNPNTISCSDCPSGRYADVKGLGVCKACGVGRYNFNAGATYNCNACGLGKYQPDTAKTHSSDCKSCEPGSYGDAEGLGVCKACGVGRYNSNTGSNSSSDCQDCGKGWYTDTATASICKGCQRGEYSDNVTSGSCKSCPVGRFRNSWYATSLINCKECPKGWYQDQEKSENCVDCPAGYVQDEKASDKCDACAPGQYQEHTRQWTCDPCPVYSYSNENATVECTRCVNSRTIETGKTKCFACPVGKRHSGTFEGTITVGPDGDNWDCVDCGAGKYQDDISKDSCKTCDKGTYSDTVGANSSDTCEGCPIGKFGSQSGLVSEGDCSQCTHGKFQNETGQPSCKSCPLGKQLIGDGGNSFNDCTDCEVGKYGESDSWYHRKCTDCSAGTHQNIKGQSECKKCSFGKFAASLGLEFCSECPLARYSDTEGLSECKKCTVGKFQDNEGQSNCKFCMAGKKHDGEVYQGDYEHRIGFHTLEYTDTDFWNETTYSAQCVEDCPAGTYKQYAMAYCWSCQKSFYNDEPGQSVCKDCPGHTYSDSYGQTSSSVCKNCPAGRKGLRMMDRPVSSDDTSFYFGGWNKEWLSVCGLCNYGKYSSVGTTCQYCPDGKYNPNPGEFTCLTCPAGKYQQQSQKAAISSDMTYWTLPNEKKDNGNFYSIDDIDHYTTNAAETGVIIHRDIEEPTPENGGACFTCPAGYYSSRGSAECQICPRNYYSQEGQHACTEVNCPPRSPTDKLPGEGSTTVNEACLGNICPQGTFLKDSTCHVCEAGKYQDEYGQTECKICSDGQEPNTAANGCVDCPKGSFEKDTGVCQQAPYGTYVDSTGASTTKNCSENMGNVQGATSAAECGACPEGWSSVSGMPCRQNTCPAHTQRNADDVCEPCSDGMHKPSMRTFCTICQYGMFSRSGYDCKKCSSGHGVGTDGECQECPTGTYSLHSKCVSCPDNLWTDGPGKSRREKLLGDLDTCIRDAHYSITDDSGGSTSIDDILQRTQINVCITQ